MRSRAGMSSVSTSRRNRSRGGHRREFAHQLRSVLDHLVFELRRWYFAREGKDPNKLPRGRITFPIDTSPKNFREKKEKRIGTLPEDWQDLIEALQPHDGWDTNHLAWLEEIWNADKHSSVYRFPPAEFLVPLNWLRMADRQQVIFSPKQDVSGLGESRFQTRKSLKADAEIARVKVEASGANPQVDMNCDIEVAVTVGEGSTWQATMLLGMQLFRAWLGVEGLLGVFPTGRPPDEDALRDQVDLSLRRYPARVVTRAHAVSPPRS